MDNVSDRRRMFIDDNLGEAQYSGTWYLDTYAQPGPFQWVGSAAKQSAHCTNSTGGFSFTFEGGSFSAQGQSNVIPSTTNSQLTCKVDGRDGNTAIVTADNVNAWSFCNSGGLTESLHEVVVNITAGPGTVFCLDDIYSISSPNSILQNKYAMFVPNDGGYRYAGVSWSNPFDKDGLLGRETYATGAKVVIPFYGESVELDAYLTSRMPRVPGRGSYSIDKGPSIDFEVPTWTSGFRGAPTNQSLFRVRLFMTDPLPVGHHTVEVTNLGNESTMPLPIDYLYVSYGDIEAANTAIRANSSTGRLPSTGTTTTSSPTGSQTLPATSNGAAPSGKTSPWPLVGGAVGAVLVLVLAAFVIYIWLARQKRSKKVESEDRLTREEAQTLAMQSRNLTMATAPYATEPTPPRYSTNYPYQHVSNGEAVEATTGGNSSGPPLVVPPQKQQLGPPIAQSTGTTSSTRITPGPSPHPSEEIISSLLPQRRLPARLPAKKRSDV